MLMRVLVLLYLHRSFFAQAIVDCPRNPIRSAYAHSFLTAYRSSVIILKVIREQFKQHPTMCARFWVIWTFAFSASVSSRSISPPSDSHQLPPHFRRLRQRVDSF